MPRRTFGQDANHVGQAQRGQLKGALVARPQDVKGGGALKHRLGTPVADITSQHLHALLVRALQALLCLLLQNSS